MKLIKLATERVINSNKMYPNKNIICFMLYICAFQITFNL